MCELNLSFSDIKDITLAVAAIFGILGYTRDLRLKRAEWLRSLFEKFYESSHYKDIRGILDDEKEIKNLENALKAPKTKVQYEISDKFSDYLNFFEFIAVLEKQKQIKSDEITDLFKYWLQLLAKNGIIMEYLKRWDFENLEALLEKLEVEKKLK